MKQLLLLCMLMVGMAFVWPLAKISPAVHRLNSAAGECTVVAVSSTQTYVTAAHCVDADAAKQGMEDMFLDGGGDRVHAVLIDTDHDIAILKGGANSTLRTSYLKLGKQPQRGEDVLMVGYGMGSPNLLAIPAIWLGDMVVPGDGSRQTLLSDGGVVGMSGGPIINKRGELVGLVRGGYSLPQHIIGFTTDYSTLSGIINKVAK